MGNGVSSHIDQQKYRNFESDRNLESYDEYVAEIGNEGKEWPKSLMVKY